MKSLLPLVAIALLAAQSALADTWKVSESEQLELTPKRGDYLLGEDPQIVFAATNTSNAPYTIHYLDWLDHPQRPPMGLKLTSADGADAPQSHIVTDSHQEIAARTLAPGERWAITLHLTNYYWLDEPGTYTVTLAPNASIELLPRGAPASDHKPLHCDIKLAAPTAEQAKAVFDKALNSRNIANALRPMHQRVYLPLILAQKNNLDPQKYLPALAESFSPDTTRALIQIADESSGEQRAQAMRIILSRVPGYASPEGNTLRDWLASHRPNSPPWQADMAPPLRAVARKVLAGDDDAALAESIDVLGIMSEPEDGPSIVSALGHWLNVETQELPARDHQWRTQPLTRVCQRLLARGYTPAANPQTYGEIVVYLSAIGGNDTFRPTGWEARCAEWTHSTSPTIRQLVLDTQPAPLNAAVAQCLPELLQDHYKDVAESACVWLKKEKHPETIPAILKLLDSADDEHLTRSAFEAALYQGARVDALQTVVDRLEEENRMLLLCDVTVHGGGSRFIRKIDPAEVPGLKKQWHAWLEAHRKELAAGKQFRTGDPALPRELFPKDFQIHLPDGTFWPPRER